MNVIGMMRTPKFVSNTPFVVDKIHMGNFASYIRTEGNKSFKNLFTLAFKILSFVGKRRLT